MREITTPNLPGFITGSLNLLNAKKNSGGLKGSPLLEIVLSAFAELVGRHPTIFRPFVGQLQKLLLPFLSSSTASSSLSSKAIHLSQELFIALHHCAPKNTSGEQWANDCKSTIASVHQAADHIFRSVFEQWESSDPNFKQRKRPTNLSEVPQNDESDSLGLPPWQGLRAGAIRLTTLLNLLTKFISTRTASPVNHPLGAILDLTSRLTSVTVPQGNDDGAQSNSEFSRDERAGLYMELPRIHTTCIDLFRTILRTFGTGSAPIMHTLLEQTLWVFEAENFNSRLRESSYLLVGEVLPLQGRTLAKDTVFALSPLIRQCCRDLVPADMNRGSQEQQNAAKGHTKNAQFNLNVDTLLNPALKESSSGKEAFDGVQNSAANVLLPLLYNYLPSEFIPLPVRTEMERVAIVTGNRSAMVASVMNPIPPIKGRRPIPSILPFLTRRYAKDLEVECLVRPRMPVIFGTTSDHYDAEDYEEDEELVQAEASAAPSIDLRDASLNVTDAMQPRHTVIAPLTTQNKRILPIEADADKRDSILPQANLGQGLPHAKKARLEDDEIPAVSTSIPLTLSETSVSPAIIPPPSAPLASSAAGSDVPNLTSVAAHIQSPDVQKFTSGATTTAAGVDDSDDEMPTLNIEPDTDEDEDE